MSEIASIEALEDLTKELKTKRENCRKTIAMCAGTACRACGCSDVAEAMRAALHKAGIPDDEVHFYETGCPGFCQEGPLAVIEPGNILYVRLTPEDCDSIVERTIVNDEVIDDLLYTDPHSGQPVEKESDVPFYAAQNRTLMGLNTKLCPTEIDDYIAQGGYASLAKVLSSMDGNKVIEEVKASGLRGRGGGGYPTGRKWEQCKAAEGDEHIVICNADEGDPGAYMDGCLLEGNPHAVLEGMLIGAFAMGAEKGFIYVRKEYPVAVKHSQIAVEQARAYGLLGDNILGTGFSFDVKVARGGGAFVCGESTALMASLEGRVGEPRAKDVHTVERGYLEQPTCLNNVETWANIPHIIREGADWFASKGTEHSKGTKIFSLTGQVLNTGLVEVDMGTTLRKMIYEIGGGPKKKGRKIKAVQTGGPSGGCLPESEFDLPVDFDALYEAGSMMGSGGMVVMDDTACMVDVAKYFMNFLQDESCGKCVTCRIGTNRMLEIINDITSGNATEEELELLEDLAWTVKAGSLCALGKTAPNPVLSTLKYFRDEYDAHIQDRRCPAGVCKDLIHYTIDRDTCTDCGACMDACPHDAISDEDGFTIIEEKCRKCGICEEVCPVEAIHKE